MSSVVHLLALAERRQVISGQEFRLARGWVEALAAELEAADQQFTLLQQEFEDEKERAEAAEKERDEALNSADQSTAEWWRRARAAEQRVTELEAGE